MPTISTSTTIVVPAGQKLAIQGSNAIATVTVNPGSLGQIYTVGSEQDFFGPFDRATNVHVQVASGSVQYTTIDVAAVNALVDGGQVVTPPGEVVGGGVARVSILDGASSGTSTAWLPLAAYPERLAYALDSGSTATTFSVDISADGSTSLGQAFTGTWASTTAEITPPLMFSNPQARYFRFNVITGGPLSVSRGY